MEDIRIETSRALGQLISVLRHYDVGLTETPTSYAYVESAKMLPTLLALLRWYIRVVNVVYITPTNIENCFPCTRGSRSGPKSVMRAQELSTSDLGQSDA